jgi:hypothetical protein
VQKEGEDAPRGSHAAQRDAVAAAERLAAGDEPSRLVVEDEHGALVDERLFGKDDTTILEEPPPGG